MIRATRLRDGTVVQELEDGTLRPMADETDYQRLAAMTEQDIEAGADSDPDNPPIPDTYLSTMQRVPSPKAIRLRLRLTQEQFARQFAIPVGTVRDWEQNKKQPDSAARTLLRVIDKDPEAVIHALKR